MNEKIGGIFKTPELKKKKNYRCFYKEKSEISLFPI